MPEKRTSKRAMQDAREGKAPSTQTGEFIREEMEHIRKGKHDARSTKQAIAIGLSKARRAGVKLPLPEKGAVTEPTRRSTASAYRKGRSGDGDVSPTRSRAISAVLKKGATFWGSHPAAAKRKSRRARTTCPEQGLIVHLNRHLNRK
jgi:hypothetical protein